MSRTIKLTQGKYTGGSGVSGPVTLEWDSVAQDRSIPEVVEYEGRWYFLRTTAPFLEYRQILAPVYLNDSNTTKVKQ